MADHERHGPAIAALVYLLRDAGATNPDALALEVIAVLASRGWRLTNARPAPAGGGPAVPPTAEFRGRRPIDAGRCP